MLGKPVITFFLIFIAHLFFLTIFGFEASVFVMALTAVIFIIYNTKFLGFHNAAVLCIFYLMLYDCEIFVFTALNLRAWYAIIVYVFVVEVYNVLKAKSLPNILYIGKIPVACMVVFASISFYHIVLDNSTFKVHNIKYWVFSVYTCLVLLRFFIETHTHFDKIIMLFLSLGAFVAVWGFFQFITNLLGSQNYQLDYFNLRPAAFFSETTWFSEFLVFILILYYYTAKNYSNSNYKLFLYPVIFGLIISSSRTPYLGLFLFFLMNALLPTKQTLNQKPVINILQLVLSIFFTIVIGYILIVYNDVVYTYVDIIISKFTRGDNSSDGRKIAFIKSMNFISEHPFMGNGFAWKESDSAEIGGSAYGAKSFNLLLMITHIFGITGLLLLLALIASYVFTTIAEYLKIGSLKTKYSLIIVFYYLMVSQFAPLHQFALGSFILSVGLAFKYLALKDVNLLQLQNIS